MKSHSKESWSLSNNESLESSQSNQTVDQYDPSRYDQQDNNVIKGESVSIRQIYTTMPIWLKLKFQNDSLKSISSYLKESRRFINISKQVKPKHTLHHILLFLTKAMKIGNILNLNNNKDLKLKQLKLLQQSKKTQVEMKSIRQSWCNRKSKRSILKLSLELRNENQ